MQGVSGLSLAYALFEEIPVQNEVTIIGDLVRGCRDVGLHGRRLMTKRGECENCSDSIPQRHCRFVNIVPRRKTFSYLHFLHDLLKCCPTHRYARGVEPVEKRACGFSGIVADAVISHALYGCRLQ